MKVTWAVIFFVGYFAAVFTLPASKADSEEVEIIPLERQNGEVPVIVDTGVIGGPWLTPFDGLFESLAGMMARMREQMDYILRRLPFKNTTLADSPFPGFPDLDLDKANTTSVTKVIDGHKVVINETEYKQQGEHGGAFFKVRIIDVLPDSSELTTEVNAESITNQSKEPESVEDSFENEIPKNKVTEDFSSAETIDQPDSSHPPQKLATEIFERDMESLENLQDGPVRSALPLHAVHQPFQKITMGNTNWDTLESFDIVEDNFIDSAYPPPDLSRDIYVNQLMADAGAPVNPDAEVFSDVEYVVPHGNRRKPFFEKMMNPR